MSAPSPAQHSAPLAAASRGPGAPHGAGWRLAPLLLLLLPLLLAACGESAADERPAGWPTPSAGGSDEAAVGPRVAFLGDSITAGLHLPSDEAFPAVLARQLAALGQPIQLLAAGQSGDTSAGGLRRADWVLDPPPDVLVVELGGNDALRGQPLESIESNLRSIVAKGKAAGARVLLLGMRLPSNYGDYAMGFSELYERIATDEQLAFVPFFMDAAVSTPGFMMSDGLHPTRAGHEAIAETVLPALRAVLDSLDTP